MATKADLEKIITELKDEIYRLDERYTRLEDKYEEVTTNQDYFKVEATRHKISYFKHIDTHGCETDRERKQRISKKGTWDPEKYR